MQIQAKRSLFSKNLKACYRMFHAGNVAAVAASRRQQKTAQMMHMVSFVVSFFSFLLSCLTFID